MANFDAVYTQDTFKGCKPIVDKVVDKERGFGVFEVFPLMNTK